MAKTKTYTPISAFWTLGVPAVVLGAGYLLWNSHGFVAMRLQTMLRPIVDPILGFFRGLV